MRNWIVVLLIFVMPLGLYAYFDAQAQNNKVCKITDLEKAKNPKMKIVKFYSPMCSECKQVKQELDKVLETHNDYVVVEEINVSETSGKVGKYNKQAIKKFNITLVPTLVFLDKDGNKIKRQEGLMSRNEIVEIIDGVK